MGKLKGKVALVLGASKPGNMGQVITRYLLNEGARVVVSGRNQDALEVFSSESDSIHAVPCDITVKADIEKLVQECIEYFGGLDIAVNASGWAQAKPFCDVTGEDLDSMISVQFKGPFQFLQVVVAAMRRMGGGSIINISSVTASIMTEDYASYMGTKAGIDHVVRSVANEFGQHGIRANSVSPALTETPMTEGVFKNPALVEFFTDCFPLGRLGTSEDIAAAVVWLAQDNCFMTGQNLQVNGGVTLRALPTSKQRKAALEKTSSF